MLLEVIISALLVALIAIGTFAGLEGAGRASADERTHAEATKLAQQDEERLRGMTTTVLAELAKNGSEVLPAIEVGKIKFTVTSSASFVSAAKNSLACETTGGGANYIQTTSSVRWTSLASSRPAVTDTSIISTLITGLLVRVKDHNEEPVEGATVTLTGADSGSQTTPASGCVVFVALTPGSVTVAVSKPTWVDVNGKSPPTSKTATVVSEHTETSEAQIAEPGAVKATFESWEGAKYVTGLLGDTFVASQAGIAEPSDFVGGTAGKYEASVTTATTLFPFAKAKVAEPYTVYAGDCPANAPETVTAAGEKLKAREAKVTPGAPAAVNEPLDEPLIKVEVYQGTSATKKSAVTAPESVEIINKECEGKKAQNYPAGVTYKHKVALSGAKGELTAATTHQPYSKKLEFCVQAKVEKFDYRYQVAFENKVKAGITLATVYLKEKGTKGAFESTLLPCP